MSFRSINPHRPSEVVGEFEEAGPSGVETAVGRARKAYLEWREKPAIARSDILGRIAEDIEKWGEVLAQLVVREVGKPISEARTEISNTVSILRSYSQKVLALQEETYVTGNSRDWFISRRYPIGVCALVTSWSSPVAMPICKAAPALGYGNTIVLKPAPASTVVAGTLGTIVAQHLPEGAFEIVTGSAETGKPLVDHPDVAAVSFAGSMEVGRLVTQQVAGRGAKVRCEMGGQNSSVVLANADLDAAAENIAYAAMGYAGQKYTATSRVIVEDSVYEGLRDRLVSAIEAMWVTNPENELCQVGPLIDEHALASTLKTLERSEGTTLTGGEVLDCDGFYLAPTLVKVDNPMDHLAQEEVFAPVTALLTAASAEEALRIANSGRRGIVAAVFSDDLEEAITFAEHLEVGLVVTNTATSKIDHGAPFGVLKRPSLDRKESDDTTADFFTDNRAVLVSRRPSW